MGILNYVVGKLISSNKVINTPYLGFTTNKFILVAGSVSLILFGIGYSLYGLGSVIKPVCDIIDDFHDSDNKSSDSNSSDNKSFIYNKINYDSDNAEESSEE